MISDKIDEKYVKTKILNLKTPVFKENLQKNKFSASN